MFKGRVSALAEIGCENSAGLGYDFRNRSEAHVSNFGVAFLSPTSEIASHYFSRKKTRVLIICFARTYCRGATKFLNQLLLRWRCTVEERQRLDRVLKERREIHSKNSHKKSLYQIFIFF
jgi:hypothetical protein